MQKFSLVTARYNVVRAILYWRASGFTTLLVCLWMVSISHSAIGESNFQANERVVTGTVKADSGEPLSGVNVVVKGTNQGTITDNSGFFTIDVPEERDILVFSFIGYEPQEVSIGNRSAIDIMLLPQTNQLDEVVVVGYGTARKKDLTGSVASVNSDAIGERKVSTLNQALLGQMAGVHVELNDATPGGTTSVRVRGVGSISAGNEPLYVIDGFPVTQNEANALLPSDIESVNVLKDASSTAIYGSRGANGVILITTKSGENAAPKIQFEASYGIANVARRDYYDLLNADEYAEYAAIVKDELWVVDGNDPSVPMANRPAAYQVPAYIANRDPNVDTDWQAEVMEPANFQNYALSVRGGTEKTRYYFSVGYISDDGVIIGSHYNKTTARLRIDTDIIDDRLKAGINVSPSFAKKRVAIVGSGDVFSSVIGSAIALPPIIPVRNPDGTYGSTAGITGLPHYGNPVQLAREVENNSNFFTSLFNTYLDYKIVDGLNLRTSLGIFYNNNTNDSYYPTTTWRPFQPAPTVATGSSSYNNAINYLTETLLSYNRTIGDDHKVDILGGFTAQKERTFGNAVNANRFPNDLVHTLNAGTVTSGSSSVSEWSLISLLVRANYSYKDKYLLTATVRRDGSSRFGANVRYGTFPSVAAAWRLSEEAFLNSSEVFSNLKLRASYGVTGNNAIGNYASIGLIGITNQTFGLGAGSNYSGIHPTTLSNQDLSWEVSKQFDIGLDIGLFRERVSLVLDYYNNRTSDLLLNVNLPTTTGFASILQNIGEVENKGYEISLSTRNVVSTFGWSTNINLSHNRNKVLRLGPNGDPIYGFFGTRITEIGKEIGASNGLQMIGILSQADISNGVAIFPGERAGDPKYLDVNGDGVISNFNGPDGVNIGDPNPEYTFGITNIFTYGNFDLTVLVNGQSGGISTDLLGQGMWSFGGNNIWRSWLENRYISDEMPGDGVTPRLTFGLGGLPDTRLLQKTDFIRIANITLGYNLPTTNQSALSGLRLYLSVENLATFDDFNGYNPQVKSNGADQNAILGGFTLGGGYPVPRIVSLGLNASF